MGVDKALADHCTFLKFMYAAAPISGKLNTHVIDFDDKGDTTVTGLTAKESDCHTMGAMHGSLYFKMLDDAAFFASQARETECFVLTVSFNTIIMRPVLPGTELIAKGVVTSNSKSLIVADSQLYTGDGKLVATGSGTFMKQPKLAIGDFKKKLNYEK